MLDVVYLLAGLVVVLIVAAVVFVQTRPENLHVERTAVIQAPAHVVFAIINDLQQWGRWSPYDGRDPNMHKTFTGPTAGPGASYAWNGNKEVGEGRLTIVDSKANEQVTMKLEFVRPFACTNQVVYQLTPTDGGTRVTWLMDGKNSVMGKLVSAFINMDKMVGSDFEQGLANLNRVAQSEAQHSGQYA